MKASRHVVKVALAIILAAIVSCGYLTGCGERKTSEGGGETPTPTKAEVMEAEYDDGTNFVFLKDCGSFEIYYNTKTRAMFAISAAPYNYGCVTQLYDAEGKPMLYEGDSLR